jgi:hypothetical protein
VITIRQSTQFPSGKIFGTFWSAHDDAVRSMGNICDHTKGRGGEFAGDEVVREKRVDLENELVGMWRARAAELHAMKEKSGQAASRAAGPQGEEGAKQTAAAVPALTKSDERDLAAYLAPTVDAMLRKEIEDLHDLQSFDFLSSPRLPALGLMTMRPSIPVPRARAMTPSSPAAGGGDSDGDGDSGGGGAPSENSSAPSAGAAATGGGGGGAPVIADVRGHLRSMDAPGLAALLEQARRERIKTRKLKKHESSQSTDDGEVPVRTLLFGDAESSPALPPPLTPPVRPRRLKPSGTPPDLTNLKT